MKPAPQPSPLSAGLAAAFLALTLAVLPLVGCGGDDDNGPTPNTGSTTYVGTATGKTTSGKLVITVSTSTPAPQPGANRSRDVVTATGTFTPAGGAAIPLTGSYDDLGDVIGLSGGGWTFAGGLTSFGMEGTFTGPTPLPNTETGVFSVQQGSSSEVIVVIGTFTSTSGGANGRFNFSIDGSTIHGNAWEENGTTAIPLDGSFTSATGALSIVDPNNPGQTLATGTYDSGTGAASGTFDNHAGNSGTWSGTKQD